MITVYIYVCMCVCVCLRACVRAPARACILFYFLSSLVLCGTFTKHPIFSSIVPY